MIKKTIFFLSVIITLSAAADVEFTVNPPDTKNKIEPMWDIINLWSPSFLVTDDGQPNTQLKDTHPYLKRVILMTATGGRPDYPQNDIYKTDEQGNVYYDYSNFDKYIQSAQYNDLAPIIVLGAIPYQLAPENYHIGVFGAITDPPTDYNKWYDFVDSLVSHCLHTFGEEEISKWQWRLYTEPDNADWWSGTKEEYYKFYDYTAAAALDAYPDVVIGPGNMLGEIEDNWGVDFLDHAFADTNYYTGKIGSHIDFFTISAYENIGKDNPPLQPFESRMQTIEDKLRQYNAIDTVKTGFDEGQLLHDEDGKYLWLGDGTEYGAAWQAAYHIFGIRHGFSRIVQWGFRSDIVKAPKYNVLMMLEKMKGNTRVAMEMTTDTRPAIDKAWEAIDGIASVNNSNDTLRVFIYNKNHYRYFRTLSQEDPRMTTINISSLPFETANVKMTHWAVDSTHSNFFNVWLSEAADSLYKPDGSRYDTYVGATFTQAGHVFWWYHRDAYLEIDDLEKLCDDKVYARNDDGSLTVTVPMRPNSVSLLEFTATTETGLRESQNNTVPKTFRLQTWPNPFNSTLKIVVSNPQELKKLKIYDINGRLIKRLKISENTTVYHWKGKNLHNRTAATGVYLIYAEYSNRTIIKKVVLAK